MDGIGLVADQERDCPTHRKGGQGLVSGIQEEYATTRGWRVADFDDNTVGFDRNTVGPRSPYSGIGGQ